MKLSNLILEGLILHRIEVLIKTDSSVNQVYIYNEIRGIKNVVVVTVEQNEFLKNKSNDKHHYSLLKIKYLVKNTPIDTINEIKRDALITHRIEGLVQFIPRYKTIEKIGEY